MFSIFFTKNPNKFWFRNLIIIILIIIFVFLYNRLYYGSNIGKEGFEQKEKFVLKRDVDIYDDFYVEIYEKLHRPADIYDDLLDFIHKNTQTSKESVILDVGSGTGNLVNRLQKSGTGYQVYGIDQSKAMIQKSEEQFPEAQCKYGNALEPLEFEKSTFSHVLCVNRTIYEIENKHRFFNNCYFWIKPGGYLIVHLVDRSNFDTIVPAGKSSILPSPQKYSQKRIIDTYIDFVDFKYRANYRLTDPSNIVTFTETFVDGSTSHTRQNEQTLYMEDIDAIIKIAKSNGFIVQGKANLNIDEHQYLYIFERTL
jgi:SAM-dependent methyltransferase